MTTRTSLADLPCSVARTLDLIGDAWTVLILRDVFYGRRRFSEFADSLPIARNVLTHRLNALVAAGILRKVAYQERPLRHEYRLTDAGRDLFGVVLALARWGDQHITPAGQPAPVTFVHAVCGHDTHAEVVCAACGERLEPRDVRVRPNFGQDVPAVALAQD
ncbi:MAG TPA: helix-turn-helix domain-containing protein [Nitriliruptorales bacterium]